MQNIDIIASLFLEFSNASLMAPIITIGYIMIDRKVFFNAASLMLLGILFGTALKVTFKIPLAPSLGKAGFAFPSTHMLTSTILYGSLYGACKNNLLRTAIMLLLPLIALSLIYFGYHNIYDILFAIFIAIILIKVQNYIIKAYGQGYHYAIILIFGALCLLYNYLSYGLAPHLIKAFAGLFGLLVGEAFFGSKVKANLGIKNKTIALTLCFFITLLFYYLFEAVPAELPIYMHYIKVILMALAAPYSLYITDKIFVTNARIYK